MEATVSEGNPAEHETNGSKNAIGGSENDDLGGVEEKPGDVDRGAPHGPMKILMPLRTDAVKALQSRQRRIERLPAALIPELHYVGQIISGKGIVLDSTEGACCRWKVDHGKVWEHLSGEIFGQTQISYSHDCTTLNDSSSFMIFNHPLDIHFAAAGLQGLFAPRITLQCYRMDWHGRRLMSGYGFAHLPTTPGPHRIEVSLWRPVGSNQQEMEAHLLGSVPALVSHQPIYEAAWRERCRLVTISAGKVFIDLFVMTRNLKGQGIDFK